MNRFKFISGAVLGVLMLFVACDPAENSYTADTYTVDVYTVGSYNTLTPEFEDTLLTVSNFSSFDLTPGERVCLYMHQHFDAYDSRANKLEIVQIVERIPTLYLTPREEVDASEYNMPLGTTPYWYKPNVWMWNDILNVSTRFYAKKEATEFAMSVRAVRNDTIQLNLSAKTTAPSDTLAARLLSYDLDNIATFLTDDEKASLKGYEKLKFRIFMKENVKTSTGKDSIAECAWNVTNAEFVNPVR